MLHKETIEELAYLLEQAEETVWKKAEGVMLHLYWQLGYCLREYSPEEIIPISQELSCIFSVEAEMFRTAYRFYKNHPIKKKALRFGA